MDNKNVFPILFFYKNENLLEKKIFFLVIQIKK